MKNVLTELYESYALSDVQIIFFRKNGFIKLSDVLSPAALAHYEKEITKWVNELNTQNLPMEQRSTYKKAFLQITNLWTKSEVVKEFAFSKKIAQIAAALMGTTGVRMYHDQALYKEPGGGFTPWHADQYYWPLATEKCCTAWIPFQETPLEMGPLAFAARSHKFSIGRDMPISNESEAILYKTLKDAKYEHVIEPFNLGDVSFHYGWTFHNAGPNKIDEIRKVMTMIYMDEDMKLMEPDNKNQKIDWDVWCPGAEVGKIINTELNPVLYSNKK